MIFGCWGLALMLTKQSIEDPLIVEGQRQKNDANEAIDGTRSPNSGKSVTRSPNSGGER